MRLDIVQRIEREIMTRRGVIYLCMTGDQEQSAQQIRDMARRISLAGVSVFSVGDGGFQYTVPRRQTCYFLFRLGDQIANWKITHPAEVIFCDRAALERYPSCVAGIRDRAKHTPPETGGIT